MTKKDITSFGYYAEIGAILAYQAFEPSIPYGVSDFLTWNLNLDSLLGDYSFSIPSIGPTLGIPTAYGLFHELARGGGPERVAARVLRDVSFHFIPFQASAQYLGEIVVTAGIAEGFRLRTPFTKLTKYLSEYFSQRK